MFAQNELERREVIYQRINDHQPPNILYHTQQQQQSRDNRDLLHSNRSSRLSTERPYSSFIDQNNYETSSTSSINSQE